MKSTRIYIIITILLAFLAVYLIMQNKKGTIKKELRDFAVEDTAIIDKLFLADKTGKKITLEKKPDGSWSLNGKYSARKDAVRNLLETVKTLTVKTPVAKAAMDNVIKNLAAISTKVEIYQNNELVKTYYVGGPTMDNQGTYMMLENSSTPFVMHIPGFVGYLSTRYFTDETKWRDVTVFNVKYADLASIEINYPEKPEESFHIAVDDTGNVTVTVPKLNKTVAPIDTNIVKEYFTFFKNINFEFIVTDLTQTQVDSVKKSKPAHIITVTDVNGHVKSITTFLKKLPEGTTDMNGNKLTYDLDRMYALFQDDLVMVQFFVFDKLLVPATFFKDGKVVKN